MTGTFVLSGSQAVANWMASPEHEAIITEPGILKVYIGVAWVGPSAVNGYSSGYVYVMDVCANLPGFTANCP